MSAEDTSNDLDAAAAEHGAEVDSSDRQHPGATDGDAHVDDAGHAERDADDDVALCIFYSAGAEAVGTAAYSARRDSVTFGQVGVGRSLGDVAEAVQHIKRQYGAGVVVAPAGLDEGMYAMLRRPVALGDAPEQREGVGASAEAPAPATSDYARGHPHAGTVDVGPQLHILRRSDFLVDAALHLGSALRVKSFATPAASASAGRAAAGRRGDDDEALLFDAAHASRLRGALSGCGEAGLLALGGLLKYLLKVGLKTLGKGRGGAAGGGGAREATITLCDLRQEKYEAFMWVDEDTLRSLQIFDTEHHPGLITKGRGRTKNGFSLFSQLDDTVSPLGARQLRLWLLRPSRDAVELEQRLDAVQFLADPELEEPLAHVRRALTRVRDVPAALRRMRENRASAQDWRRLVQSLEGAIAAREWLVCSADAQAKSGAEGGRDVVVLPGGVAGSRGSVASISRHPRGGTGTDDGQLGDGGLPERLRAIAGSVGSDVDALFRHVDETLEWGPGPVNGRTREAPGHPGAGDGGGRGRSRPDSTMDIGSLPGPGSGASSNSSSSSAVQPRWGVSPALDELRRQLARLPSSLQRVAEQEATRYPELAQLGVEHMLRVVFLPRVGYSIQLPHAVCAQLAEHMAPGATAKAALASIGLEFQFEDEGMWYLKNATMSMLDEKLGDFSARIADEEAAVLRDVQRVVLEREARLQLACEALGQLDCLMALGWAAKRHTLTRPRFLAEARIRVTNGRHPLQELSVDTFVPNGLELGGADGSRIQVLTGPNSSGKSVFLKQAGVVQIMAQVGSFVPAESAELPLVDRIFTRIESLESVALAHSSSFSIDASQVATMLAHASPHSLVLLDEFGKGTDIVDGIALLAAVLRALAQRNRSDRPAPLTIVTTHLHEVVAFGFLRDCAGVKLSQMEVFVEGGPQASAPGVGSEFSIGEEVAGRGDSGGGIGGGGGGGGGGRVDVDADARPSAPQQRAPVVTPLFRVTEGATSSSFGAECALRAGVPHAVVARARQVAASLAQGVSLHGLWSAEERAGQGMSKRLVQQLGSRSDWVLATDDDVKEVLGKLRAIRDAMPAMRNGRTVGRMD